MHNAIFQAIVITTLIILLLVAGIVVTFIISGRQRLRQKMALAEAKLAFERELRTVENEVSENIMSQFGQELHDNIGQLITAMHMQVENQKIDHPQLAHGLKPIEIYLAEVNQQLRLLSRTFNNDYLLNIGLLSAIQLEVDRLRTLRRFEVVWEPVVGRSNLEKNQELMVFRILQEIIQNALRHASATKLQIIVKNNDQNFEMHVKDNGKGFKIDDTMNSHKSSGLRNIQKRAKLAGIACTIASEPGKGTSFILKKELTLDDNHDL